LNWKILSWEMHREMSSYLFVAPSYDMS
jgi:hypothetical protein